MFIEINGTYVNPNAIAYLERGERGEYPNESKQGTWIHFTNGVQKWWIALPITVVVDFFAERSK